MNKSCLVWVILILIIGVGGITYSKIKSNEAAEKKKVERQKEIADSIAQAKKDAESKKPFPYRHTSPAKHTLFLHVAW